MSDLPPLVRRAAAAAAAAGLAPGCRDEDGRLRHVLAGRRGLVRVAAIGTGGVAGAAWVVAALAPQVPFLAVEPDAAAASVSRELLSGDPAVVVLDGGWEALLPAEAPFDLVVAEGGLVADRCDAVAGLLTPGGTVLVDGLTGAGTDGWAPWLGHPALAATVVGTGGGHAAIVATRTR